jgi:hypothetical protein
LLPDTPAAVSRGQTGRALSRRRFRLPTSVKLWIQDSKLETEDVVRREVDRGVIQQPRIEAGQRLAAGEDQVGGVLGLVDDPVITGR